MLDFGFFFVSVLFTVGSVFWALGPSSGSGPLYAQIQSTGGTSVYPMSETRDIKVDGPAGVTWLRIENKEIFAVDSPGPHRIIMQMGKIHEQGQWLASLPNKVFVRIVSASGDASRSDVDAQTF